MKNFFNFATSEPGFMLVLISSVIFLCGSITLLSNFIELNAYNQYSNKVIECRIEMGKQQHAPIDSICGTIPQRKDF